SHSIWSCATRRASRSLTTWYMRLPPLLCIATGAVRFSPARHVRFRAKFLGMQNRSPWKSATCASPTRLKQLHPKQLPRTAQTEGPQSTAHIAFCAPLRYRLAVGDGVRPPAPGNRPQQTVRSDDSYLFDSALFSKGRLSCRRVLLSFSNRCSYS